MSKIIQIDGKDYEISCNAYTRFLYKKTFGTGLMTDVQKLAELSTKQDDLRTELKKKKMKDEDIEKEVNSRFIGDVDEFIDVIEKMAYILILTANPNFGSFEDFLKGINTIDLSSNWVSEVTETAVSSFR